MSGKGGVGDPEVVGRVRSEGAALHFEVYDRRPDRADGPPLVLLHGNGEDLHTLDAQIAGFAARHRVVAVDTRGHGRSGAGQAPWDFPLLARDVVAVLDGLGVPRAFVFGFSDGGNTALQLVVDAPGRLAGIVVVGANLDPSGLTPPTRAGMVLARALHRVAAPVSRRSRAALPLYGLMLDHPRIDPARLRAGGVPALVVVGERDVVRPAHTELVARSLPGSRTAVVRGAGHMVPVTHAAEVNRLVLDFLDGLG